MDFGGAFRPLLTALLIGFLVGAEREASREETERQPGVRDFALIALSGAVAALLGNPYLTAAALLSIAALLAAFHWKAAERSGVTTEMAAISTFCLGFLTASPGIAFGPSLAIAVTILMVFVLEAKRALHRFIREAITETEFADTVRFLALVFVVYPLLPEGRFGPYGALVPREIWLFIILVSSVSYVGYFLEKFLGTRIGMRLAGLLAGLASTTAATASFARAAADRPERRRLLAQAAVLANAMQFPRVAAVVMVANPSFGWSMLAPLAAMTLAALAVGWALSHPADPEPRPSGVGLRNPFRLRPALQFGLLFAAIVFLNRAAVATLGAAGAIWVAILGGSVDADAAVLAISDVGRGPSLAPPAAGLALLVALAANAVFKSAFAVYAGGLAFGRILMVAFAAMFACGGAAWFVVRW